MLRYYSATMKSPSYSTRGLSDHRYLALALFCVLLVVLYSVSTGGGRDPAASSLKVATWNMAAINNNPFEYWLTISDDPKYNELMSRVEALVKTPGAKNVPVSDIFTEDMFKRLLKEMRGRWAGLDAATQSCRLTPRCRSSRSFSATRTSAASAWCPCRTA
jgi:hypothetical protein